MIQIFFLLPLSVCCLLAKDKPNHKMPLDDNLVAYWNMEQNPVLFPLHDQTGRGNNLTAAEGSSATVGKNGNAVNVGSSSRLFLAGSNDISHQGNSFTVAFWVKLSTLDEHTAIAGHPDGQWLVQLELNGADFYFRVRVNPDSEDYIMNVTEVPLVVGEWYWVALGWYDDNGSYAWATVNLSARVRTAAPGPLATPANLPVFWSVNVFDEAAIWRRSVSASELADIYNDGEGLPLDQWDEAKPCRKITCCD